MYDDEPLSEPLNADLLYADEPAGRSRLRGCLFLTISLVLILSLVGSSAVAFLIVRDRMTRTMSEAAATAVATAVPLLESPLESPEAATNTPPTAAPATIVAAVPTPAPVGDESPTSGINRIAIVNGEGQIETLSPTGEDRRSLTDDDDNTFFQFPAWSPDGSRIAVIGSRFVGGGVYVFEDVETGAPAADSQVYFSADEMPFYLYWSPDSSHLAFLANYERTSMGLNVIAGDGATDSQLLVTGSPMYWDWTDDGDRLLVHSGQRRSRDTLALIDLQGSAQADNLATPGYFQAPGIASGDRYLAFAEQERDGLSSLVVVDTQSGEHRAYQQAGSIALSWSPTDARLAFTSGAVEGHPFWGSLHLLDVNTGESRVLSTQTVLAFFWSPDGRSIAFITIGRDDESNINASAPSKTRRISRLTTPLQQPGQNYLTLSVVDVDTGEGLRLLDFEPTATYITQFLPFFDQYALSHRIWSPDSSALVLPAREGSANVVLVVPARGGRPYRLAEGDIAFWSQQ
jgi:TolB protein